MAPTDSPDDGAGQQPPQGAPDAGDAQPAQYTSRRQRRDAERASATSQIPAVPVMPANGPYIPAEALQAPAPERPLLDLGPDPALAPTAPSGVPPKVTEDFSAAEPVPTKAASKAGRDLPAAIGVGVALLVIVLAGLLFFPPAFMILTIIAALVGAWEVSRALLQRSISVPVVPLFIGMIALPLAAYAAGAEGLIFAFVLCALGTVVFRVLDSRPGAGKSILAAIFMLVWVPLLLSFVLLMLRQSLNPADLFHWGVQPPRRGALMLVTVLLLVISNDTFGYIFGALFGKHPMAPKISPKKSWEGFAGSIVGAMVVGALAVWLLLGEPFWIGIVLAVAVVLASTTGDLAESMVKRELGVKDMSSILPGHGGVMDRLDSVLFALPIGYLAFALLDGIVGIVNIG